MSNCIEHDSPADCEGEVVEYATLSGSGMTFPRCERGYQEYVERVQPRMNEIRDRYPDSPFAPSWFDPTYAGESWDGD